MVFDKYISFMIFVIENVMLFLICFLLRGSFGVVLGIEQILVIEKSEFYEHLNFF